MRKYIVIRLVLLVLVIGGLIISVGAYIMYQEAQSGFEQEAVEQISQIEDILQENEESVAELQEDLKDDFLIRAHAAAYIVQNNKDVIFDIQQLDYIVSLLQVDEIHFFNHDGIIYSGNIPEYHGISVYSGGQIAFFAPMLNDYDLELAQDVTPNTAEKKDMQYVAVWSEDRQHIVQIGIEPVRLLDEMMTTDLSFIFSRLTPSMNTMSFAVDCTSGEIISSTNMTVFGETLSDIGMSNFNSSDVGKLQNAVIDGEQGYVYFKQHSEDIYIGFYRNETSIYDSTMEALSNMAHIALLISSVIIVLVYFLLNQTVLRGLSKIEDGMKTISEGNLEYKMDVSGLPEFKSLSSNINFMVNRVLETSGKFSIIFEYVNMPIAMYECNEQAVVVTGKMSEIFEISEERFSQELKSPSDFMKFIEEIMARRHPSENDLYIYPADSGDRFLKILRHQDGSSDWGLIIDSTEEIVEKYTIKQERDFDFLTGLYNKRSFFEQVEALSLKEDEVKKAIIVVYDLDNLKYVNDTWGHDTGDAFISAAASVLKECTYEHKMCSRLSGDEFAMVLYASDDYLQLEQQLEKIKEDFKASYIDTPDGKGHRVSASIGYSLYPEHASDFRTCITYADKALYVAKSKAKGSIQKYIPK